MLRLVTPSGTYEVSFQHTLPETKIVNHGTRLSSVGLEQKQGNTMCFLSHLESPEIIFTGKSIVHPDDHYVKEIGRRISLTKAIADMQAAYRLSDKEVREIFAAYYSR